MKRIIFGVVFSLSVMMLIPLMSFKKAEHTAVPAQTSSPSVIRTDAKTVYCSSFRIKDAKTGEITKMTADDYIFGVVAAEMPALYETEALKAQAVAAYTFACFRADSRKKESYDLTTDSHTDQSFVSKDALKERWGENADEYMKKIENAVSQVRGTVLTYNGNTALTVYHAISNGVTHSCKDVWGSDIKYLVSVDSAGDKTAAKYLDRQVFSAAAFAEKIKGLAAVSGNADKYLTDVKKTDTGLVKTVKVCGKEVSGTKLAGALDLRSASFDVTFKDGVYTFNVYGYGHGVGMSQNGANYMAKQGSTYEEILLHYYKGCKLFKS